MMTVRVSTLANQSQSPLNHQSTISNQQSQSAWQELRAPKSLPRPLVRHLAVVEHNLSVDYHVRDADRRLGGVAGDAFVLDGRGVEDREVGFLADGDDAAVGDAELSGGAAGHL